MDGMEIAACLMSNTGQCPTCKVPNERLDCVDEQFECRTSKEVIMQVKAARAEYLDEHGEIKRGCKEQVYNVVHYILYDVETDIVPCSIHILTLPWQVLEVERKIKSKIRPVNAFHNALNFDFVMSAPKEDLHQLFIGLYGEHIIPATFYRYTEVLRRDDLVLGTTKKGKPQHLVSKKMLGKVWKKVRDRLASIHSDTSMLEISSDYASHFYDMFVEEHDEKHLTGDRMKILMLTLPFVLRDLIAEEVKSKYI